MAKKPKQVKAPKPQTIWEYECVITEKGGESEVLWILEDDERSASYKAVKDFGTGRIRSKIINTDEENDWQVKVQTLLPPRL